MYSAGDNFQSHITARRKRYNMAASSVVTLTDHDASLIIDEILSQNEKEEITKMLEEEQVPFGNEKKRGNVSHRSREESSS